MQCHEINFNNGGAGELEENVTTGRSCEPSRRRYLHPLAVASVAAACSSHPHLEHAPKRWALSAMDRRWQCMMNLVATVVVLATAAGASPNTDTNTCATHLFGRGITQLKNDDTVSGVELQPPPLLRTMLAIDWRRLPDIPAQGPLGWGFQDSDGGWVNEDEVLTSFGYAGGGVAGFLNTTFLLNVSAVERAPPPPPPSPAAATGCSYEYPGNCCPAAVPAVACKVDVDCQVCGVPNGCTCHGVVAACHSGVCSAGVGVTLCANHGKLRPAATPWVKLPSAPVSGRQETAATQLTDGSFIFVGGFSYMPPYSYTDVLRLSNAGGSGDWKWSQLPPLPTAITGMGLASVGTRVYAMGGASFDGKVFDSSSLGQQLLVLDLSNLSVGWKRGPDLPGSPRGGHSFTAVGGQSLYLLLLPLTDIVPVYEYLFYARVNCVLCWSCRYTIGGSYYNSTLTANVVDNWVFDLASAKWSRIIDLPTSSSLFKTNVRAAPVYTSYRV